MLPALLHIKMTALLDEALDAHMQSAGISLPGGYRADLNGRISFYSDTNRVPNGPDLHSVRSRRNALAHETSSDLAWTDLDQDIEMVQAALNHLGLVGARPSLKAEAERSAARESADPRIFWMHEYIVRILDGERLAAEFKWEESILRSESSQPARRADSAPGREVDSDGK